MSNDEKYNGWTNYETWLTALWIDNDYISYENRKEMVLHAQLEYPNNEEKQIWMLAGLIKDWMEELNPLSESSSLYADLINSALSEVDWGDIAEHYLAEG